ncbi:substrate-binding periplasmic protein [Algicola sagamiensis]|uniref:substrate-binding periplasmic protein n=1 Tax=Algicola sagamiensis TaxID=163869 RepID=UPI00146A7D36|nr:transporter substrate-binding domain-containing protein [Algicola sagamiensis]
MNTKRVSAATLYGYPPFTYTKNNNTKSFRETILVGQDSKKLKGTSWQCFRQAMQQQGYVIELIVTNWSRAYQEVQKGEIELLFPTALNSNRLRIFHYSANVLNRIRYVIYTRYNAFLDKHSIADLKGLTIGVMRGFEYGEFWRKNKHQFEVYPLDHIERGLLMLDKAHLDGFLGYEVNWDLTIMKMGKLGHYRKLKHLGENNEFVVSSKKSKTGLEKLKAFDEGFQQIEALGIPCH